MSGRRGTLAERLAAKYEVDAETGCWTWTAHCNRNGYGMISSGGRGGSMLLAHRAAYEIHSGPIPAGMELDHLCRNRACVNPAHLEAVTRQENVRRSEAGRNMRIKTHCPQGHPYDADNTYRTPPTRRFPNGRRSCRICMRDARSRYELRKRVAA